MAFDSHAQHTRPDWLKLAEDIVSGQVQAPKPTFWDPDAAFKAEMGKINAAFPARGSWRPLSDHDTFDGFGPARLGEDR